MKFASAFLAPLLFFGATPSALGKKSDDYALATTSSSFATTSIVALVVPNNADITDITEDKHLVLEARARARGSRGTTRKSHPLKNKTTTTGRKKKNKNEGKKVKKCTAAMKKAGKCRTKCTPAMEKSGKCKVKCTAARRKAGKCPEKAKRWEVLSPTKGCRPRKTKGSKVRKGGKKTGRDLFSPTTSPSLLKRAATFEPALRNEAGIMAWTKEVFATSPRALHMPETTFQPTSIFHSWASLGEGVKFVTVDSLKGCTSVVVVSNDGVYVSHHWQNTVGDKSHADLPPQFANAFTNPLTGRRRASFRLDARQRKIATDFDMSIKMTEDLVNEVFPTSAQFDALTNHMSAFTAAKGAQSMVAVWDGIHGNGDEFRKTGEIMRKFINDLVPGHATKLVEYGNTREDALKTSRDKGDYHGKIIVSYDSATRKYQVWMPAADLKAPILKN